MPLSGRLKWPIYPDCSTVRLADGKPRRVVSAIEAGCGFAEFGGRKLRRGVVIRNFLVRIMWSAPPTQKRSFVRVYGLARCINRGFVAAQPGVLRTPYLRGLRLAIYGYLRREV